MTILTISNIFKNLISTLLQIICANNAAISGAKYWPIRVRKIAFGTISKIFIVQFIIRNEPCWTEKARNLENSTHQITGKKG